MFDGKEVIDFVMKNLYGIPIATFWGVAHYMFKVLRWEKFLYTKFAINLVLAAFVGYICTDIWLSNAWIAVAWYCTYPILDILEKKWAEMIFKFLIK